MRKVDSDTEKILARVRHLRPHEHVCAVHENKQNQLAIAAAFIRGGLERGECLYVAAGTKPQSIVAALRLQGVDVRAALKSGMLTISDKRTYLPEGRFDPDAMIRFIADCYRVAKLKGLPIRFAGEMTWVTGGDPGTDKLIEYEAKLNDFVRKCNVSILCQYFRPDFDNDIILNVLRTHPLVIYREFMSENPYYIPAAKLLNGKISKLEVDQCLKVLRDHASAKEELRELSLRLLHSQDEERRRIARELHDSTGQNLSGLAMNLVSLRKLNPKLVPAARRLLARSLRLAKQAARETSTISYLLHPPILDEFGLADALRWYVRGFSKRSRIDVELTINPKLDRLLKEVELAVFRVVQEALTNVYRHSRSKRVQIRVALRNGVLRIQVRDFGKGLRLSKAPQPLQTVGLGIAGMRERLRQLGGEFDLLSSTQGTVLRGSIPIERAM